MTCSLSKCDDQRRAIAVIALKLLSAHQRVKLHSKNLNFKTFKSAIASMCTKNVYALGQVLDSDVTELYEKTDIPL